MLEWRESDEIDVQRPWKASAVESGGGREKGDDEEYDQSRRRASAHEAPALGDFGDELARTIAGSLFVMECSELLGSGILTEGHFIEAQNPGYLSSGALGTLRGRFARDLHERRSSHALTVAI